MKKIFGICLLFIIVATPCFAKDFILEFIEENYKETQAQFSYSPLIYHSVQVNSSVGPKILILTGTDYTYRNWLRQYLAQNKKLITKIPDEQTDDFISAKAYEVDVTALHPFNGLKWNSDDATASDQITLEGNNHILIVDPNEKRTHLVQTVAEKMNYRVTIFKDGDQALDFFKLQPEKFKLVIAHYTAIEMPSNNFVEKVLNINQKLPILIDTGYHNQTINNEFLSKFSGSSTVHVIPVILRDLQKTIETLIKKNA